MKITYIAHSGFLMELAHTLFLFDYYQGEIPALPPEKPLYVFASHRHPDHFNPEIFGLARDRENSFFVLSHDIWRSRVPEELRERTVHLKAGARWQRDGVEVDTLRSTDEGVAFLVRAEGKAFYHAGDLNDWRWDGEPENWNWGMAEKFRRYIEPLREVDLDAAFVPLDPRQEEHYALGLDYFLTLADYRDPKRGAKKIFPMHCWDEYGIIDRWLSEHPDFPGRERIVKISGRGESFTL